MPVDLHWLVDPGIPIKCAGVHSPSPQRWPWLHAGSAERTAVFVISTAAPIGVTMSEEGSSAAAALLEHINVGSGGQVFFIVLYSDDEGRREPLVSLSQMLSRQTT